MIVHVTIPDQSVLQRPQRKNMPSPQTTFLNIDGTHLEYRRYGPSQRSRPTLVLLHEGLGCVEMWKRFPQQLAEATECQVLAYSRRGYGESDGYPPPWPLTYMHEEALESLPRVLDAAAIESAILIGHSDGASIALIHAGGRKDPRVHAMILMAPHVFNEENCVDSIRQARTAFEKGELRKGLQRYHGKNVDDAFWGWNRAWLDPDFMAWNIEEYLPEILTPLLLIQGEDDQYGSRRQLEAISTQAPAPVTTHLLPNCRHAPHHEQPEATLKAITQFIAELA